MASIEPQKAAPISAAEPRVRPRASAAISVRATVSFAPDEMPSTKGPAMGFAKKVCSRKPDTASAPPRKTAASSLGSRSVQTTRAARSTSPRTSRTSSASFGETFTLPASRPAAPRAIRRRSSRANAQTQRRVCLSTCLPPYCSL